MLAHKFGKCLAFKTDHVSPVQTLKKYAFTFYSTKKTFYLFEKTISQNYFSPIHYYHF